MTTTRRNLLKAAKPLGALPAGLPTDWAGAAYSSDAPENTTVRFGITALTDNAAIIMAHELGLFKKFGVESVISKEPSWAFLRDKLTLGENQATHMLMGMAFASAPGPLGSPMKRCFCPTGC